MSKNYILFAVFILTMLILGCIAEDSNVYFDESLDISRIYSTFSPPHSLEITSVNAEANLTKVVYVNEERDTVIFMVQPDNSDLAVSDIVIIMDGVEVHFINKNYYYVYVWTINGYRFSITGTNEIISKDFVGQMILHTRAYS